MVDRHDVNREDWKTIDAWLAAVLAGLPELALKTVSELGGDTRDCSDDTLPLT